MKDREGLGEFPQNPGRLFIQRLDTGEDDPHN